MTRTLLAAYTRIGRVPRGTRTCSASDHVEAPRAGNSAVRAAMRGALVLTLGATY